MTSLAAKLRPAEPAQSAEAQAWRVLHVLDHSLPIHDGYVFRTLGILAAQRARGWTTAHLTSPRQGAVDGPTQELEGWRFHRTPPRAPALDLPVLREWSEMTETTRRLLAVAEQERPTIIQAHSPVLNALPALRVGRRLRIPVVYEVRAFWEDAGADQGKGAEGSLRWRAIRAIETWAFRRAQAITTICEGLRNDIVGRGIATKNVTVIPNAVDASRFGVLPPAGAAERAAIGLPDVPVIGFIGSLYQYEGIDLLMEAAARLRDRRADLRFVIVGGGMEEAALKEKLRASRLGDSVQMVGRVPNREVERYYAAMDVMVYPRRSLRLTETVTPLKPLEAMAQGRIVMASDVGGHRELIADGRTGYLFRPDDPDALAAAIERVVDARAEWAAMRINARRFVEHERTWAASVARYAGVYASARAGLG